MSGLLVTTTTDIGRSANGHRTAQKGKATTESGQKIEIWNWSGAEIPIGTKCRVRHQAGGIYVIATIGEP
jgi:hypothetical protein